MLGWLKTLFCDHSQLTFLSVLNSNGDLCRLAFCCECGVLRRFMRFIKREPPISRDPEGRKYIEQYPESGSYRTGPLIFGE